MAAPASAALPPVGSDQIAADLGIVRGMVERLLDYRESRISLISSENVTSRLLRASYALGLSDQYCSRLPAHVDNVGNLSFSNISPLDEINDRTRRLVLELFHAAECDVRPLSGLSGLNILLFSLLDNEDLLYRVHDDDGGHLSTGPIARRLNIRMGNMRLGRDYRLDLDAFRSMCERERPKAVFLDSSYVLFPYPVAEIREILGSGPALVYDASHLIALVAHGLFQSPFEQGADLIHATTHKTLWGPQKSMILFRRNDGLVAKVHDVTKDLVSNTHLHHVFALYIALLEFKHFGLEYARRLKENARLLAESLSRHGLNVAAEKYGFTESSQVWLELGSKAEAVAQFRKVDQTNISLNVILLPGGRWGFRLAVNELTRLGAGATELEAIAKLLSDLLQGRKDVPQVRRASAELRRGLGEPQFTFDSCEEARRTIELVQAQNRRPKKVVSRPELGAVQYRFIDAESPYYEQTVRLRYDVFYKSSQLSLAAVQDELEGRSLHLVALHVGRVVGYIRLTVDGGVGKLTQFVVAPDMRGRRRVAKTLYATIVERAQTEGVSKLTGVIRLPLVEVARKFGFTVSEEDIPSPKTGLPHRYIEKSIAALDGTSSPRHHEFAE